MFQTNILQRFLKWWERKTFFWIVFIAVTHIAQFPHMYWNADLMFELGTISRINPVSDFILYGIDLIEIPSIIIVVTTLIAHLNKRRNA